MGKQRTSPSARNLRPVLVLVLAYVALATMARPAFSDDETGADGLTVRAVAAPLSLGPFPTEFPAEALDVALLPSPSTFDIVLAGGTLPDEYALLGPELPLPDAADVRAEEIPSPESTPEEVKPPPATGDEAKKSGEAKPEDAKQKPASPTTWFGTWWPAPLPEPLRLWSGRVEYGLNGTDGNSRQMSSHSVGKLCRKTPSDEITLNVTHDYAKSKSKVTANQLIYEGRFEQLFQESPWTAFVHDTVEYNQFAAFDSRIGFDGGFGYRFIDSDSTKLKGRIGAGASREYGVRDSQYKPEGTFTGEFEHKFWERHKIAAKSEWFPEMEEWGEYRAKNEAGWETKLNAAHPLSFKLSMIDRFDSSPNGARKHDLQYSALAVWEF